MPDDTHSALSHGRPLPFALRVGAEWIEFDEISELDRGPGYFWTRGPLTGDLCVTANGLDVQFSDIGAST